MKECGETAMLRAGGQDNKKYCTVRTILRIDTVRITPHNRAFGDHCFTYSTRTDRRAVPPLRHHRKSACYWHNTGSLERHRRLPCHTSTTVASTS